MPSSFAWQTAVPEEHGLSTDSLARWKDTLAARHTTDLLVVRHGRIVYEWHAPGRGPDSLHFTASLAKALVGGMSLVLTLADGRLDLDDRVADYVPAWRGHPLKSQVAVRHLATHCSGLEDAHSPSLGHFELAGWKEAFWRREPDPFTVSRDQAPMAFPPGTDYLYSNPGMAMLAYVVTAALREGPHTDILTLLRERIMRPLGVRDEDWSIGYGTHYDVDGLRLYANWGGGAYTARAAAAVGLLMMRGGDWQGEQLIPEESVHCMLSGANAFAPAASEDPNMLLPGLCWWLNADGRWPAIPRDAFFGLGAGHQVLMCIPSMDLVVVRYGDFIGKAHRFGQSHSDLLEFLVEPLCDAFLPVRTPHRARAPYPPSPVIRRVSFDPPSSILRRAYDSDNWPLTWADDDALYGAYGDGRGFYPHTEHKLGLGFARIVGSPEGFHGLNIRSATGENLGMGASGAKASGMLSVKGTLYMLVRNAANAQLAWSEDRGHTWTWADWRFTTSFGYPTFLNYGRDYAGARDEYVYIYSHDGDSAYIPADRFVLARVSKDIADRGAVFENPGRCARSSVSYNAGLGRYLWWQSIPSGGDVDVRFRGGFGLYDAPEPWGPWTTAYYTEEWDVGPGEMGVLPTKWMSADGRTCYLVFSGYDYFSVRRMVLETFEI